MTEEPSDPQQASGTSGSALPAGSGVDKVAPNSQAAAREKPKPKKKHTLALSEMLYKVDHYEKRALLEILADIDSSKTFVQEERISVRDNHIVMLNLNDLELPYIPRSVYSGSDSLRYLELLYVANNRIARVPPRISELKQLKEFDIYGNLLEELPPEIGLFNQLEMLSIGKNRLTQLPMQIRDINSKDASGNLIKHYSGRIPLSLYAQGNPFEHLEPGIENLNLKQLFVDGYFTDADYSMLSRLKEQRGVIVRYSTLKKKSQLEMAFQQ